MSAVILLVGLVVCSCLTLVVHEVGHLVVAKLVGWKCVGIGVFGRFVPWRRTIAMGFLMPKWDLVYVGGVTLAFPEDIHRDERWRYSVYLTGGMIANLVFAGILAVLWWVLGHWYCGALMVLPVLNVIGAAVPVRLGGAPTDGQKLRNLLRGNAEVERLLFNIGYIQLTGSATDLTQAQLETLVLSEDPIAKYYGLAYGLLKTKEIGDCDLLVQQKAALRHLLDTEKYLQKADPLQMKDQIYG